MLAYNTSNSLQRFERILKEVDLLTPSVFVSGNGTRIYKFEEGGLSNPIIDQEWEQRLASEFDLGTVQNVTCRALEKLGYDPHDRKGGVFVDDALAKLEQMYFGVIVRNGKNGKSAKDTTNDIVTLLRNDLKEAGVSCRWD